MGEHRDFRDAWETWRAERLAGLRQRYGLLSLVDLYWLSDQPERFARIPGRWWATDRGVFVDVPAADRLTVAGRTIGGLTALGTESVCFHHDVMVEVMSFGTDDGARFALRIRDPRCPHLVDFSGIPTYPPDPRWVLPARFEPYDRPRTETLHTAMDGFHKRLAIFGRVAFAYQGAEHALEVYAGAPDELHIPFRDQTSGVTTYGGARIVAAPIPMTATNARLDFELDFNRAMNGPCGLTPHAPCALPPPGNTLPFAVEAGEQLPPWRADLRPPSG